MAFVAVQSGNRYLIEGLPKGVSSIIVEPPRRRHVSLTGPRNPSQESPEPSVRPGVADPLAGSKRAQLD